MPPKTAAARQDTGVREPLTLVTTDGERLDAVHVLPSGHAPSPDVAVVVAHGFTGSWRRPALARIAAHLAARFGVLAFDFRGHGRSSGLSTVGDREVLDVEAAVSAARALGYGQVVTLGFSMGGAAVVRHAGLHGGVDAVVTVSAPARWHYRGTRRMRQVHWVIERRMGRVVARRWLGTRVTATGWNPPPAPPTDLAPRIAPTPLLVVHGDRDPFLPVEHAQALHDAAGDPRELWVVPNFGHAEAAMGPVLLERLATRVPDLVASRTGTGG